MLEVFVSLIGPLLLSITGFHIIKKINKNNIKLLSSKSISLITILSIITIILHKAQYTGIETFLIFFINIIIYKQIFNTSLEESMTATSLMMIIIIISDALGGTILKIFFTVEDIRKKAYLTLLANIVISIIANIIICIPIIKKQLQKFYNYCQNKHSIMNIIYFITLIIGFCVLAYNIATFNNIKFLLNAILTLTLGILTYIFVKNRNNYNQLTDEYDSLFSYVQNFEDWIEKEQLNRHEYKNQLAVLYCLTKEKKVKEKINEILEDNINIGGEVINHLKYLPKGGIKGIMYYKVAIAQKKKIKITADVSLENKSILKTLTEQDIRILCKLIGIYLDNAIEAAEETRKKSMLIEVYELPSKVCFVFSNTFKKKASFDARNQKGVTTKGEGRGNGLYFASKLIDSNEWLEEKQDIVDGFYIQQLIIKRKESK